MLLSSTSTTTSAASLDSRNRVTYTITPPPPPPPPLSPPLLQLPSLHSIPSPPASTLTTISLLESRALISTSGHTGARTWEAALALGELLISPKTTTTVTTTNTPLLTLHGTSVLELGAGTGFLSILAAKLGAEKVLATDGDWRVCSILRENIQENDVGQVVSVGRLLWGSEFGVERVDDWEGEGEGAGEREGMEDGEGKEGISVDYSDDYEKKEQDKKARRDRHQEKGYIIPDLVLATDVVSFLPPSSSLLSPSPPPPFFFPSYPRSKPCPTKSKLFYPHPTLPYPILDLRHLYHPLPRRGNPLHPYKSQPSRNRPCRCYCPE